MSSRIYFSALLATTTLVALASVTRDARAFEIKHTVSGQLVSWHRTDVAWTVDASVRKVTGGEAAVTAAAEAWSEHSGAPSLAVTHVGAALTPGLDGTNAVFFAEGGYAPAGKALAITILSFDDRTGEVLDADIILNGKYELGSVARTATDPTAMTDSERGGGKYDIDRVLAHEMGHALALSDEPADTSALMYPYVARAVSLAATPADDDIAGLRALYTSVDAARVDASTTTAPASAAHGCAVARTPRSSSTRGSIYAAAGLVVAAFALGRGARSKRARRGAAGCTAFAAAALVVLPGADAPAREHREASLAFDAHAIVTKMSTTSDAGLFRSDIEVATTSCASAACPPVAHFVTWGGTVGHVRQEIGGRQLPAAGEAVALVFDGQAIQSMTRLEK